MNNWKENKEVGAICFEIRIPRKKNKEILGEVPSKNLNGSHFLINSHNFLLIINQFSTKIIFVPHIHCASMV